MKVLAFDFGLKHIGLALAEGPLAAPLGQTKFKSTEKLLELIAKQEVELVVLGLPEGRLAVQVKDLGGQIQNALKLPVVYQDETLSTQAAKAKMLAAGMHQKKRRSDHAASATVILQTWLDDHS